MKFFPLEAEGRKRGCSLGLATWVENRIGTQMRDRNLLHRSAEHLGDLGRDKMRIRQDATKPHWYWAPLINPVQL